MSEADERWHVIPVPAGIGLSKIGKERGTHGLIYCAWECERRVAVWVGQSIPALVDNINDKAVTAAEKRLHASSLYRCLRQEARKDSHKNWKVCKFHRGQVAELSSFLAPFPGVVFVTKSPDLWHCSPLDAPAVAIS